MELGVLTLHGRIRHPQTQGKDESFNRSMTKELLKHATIADQAEAQRQFDSYRDFYNNERPHHALGLDTPSQRYTPSSRPYPKQIPSWEYPPSCSLRRVRDSGFFNYGGQGYFLSEAFAGKDIAVYPETTCQGLFNTIHRIFKISTQQKPGAKWLPACSCCAYSCAIIWRTSSRSIRLILSSIVSVLVSLKCAQTR